MLQAYLSEDYLIFTYIADQCRRRWVSMAHYLLSCSMTREQLLTE